MDDNKEKRHMLMSTDISRYTFQDYKEWCEACCIECMFEEDSPEFYEWANDEMYQNILIAKTNMQDSEYAECDFMITGMLGLWDGNHGINPMHVHGIDEAIDKCIGCRDIDNYDVFMEDGEDFIKVHAHHHDGTNVFEIRKMSEKGMAEWEKAYEEYEYGDADYPEPKKEWFDKIDFEKIY